MPTHLCIICDRFHTTAAELSRLSNYNRDHMATEPKLFSLTAEKVGQPWYSISTYVYNHITSKFSTLVVQQSRALAVPVPSEME